ncbi:MAG: MFS transporter [Candidatus Babeliales bacterium]|nr:MFS transporter [Candidatus Babeliales bacterium]
MSAKNSWLKRNIFGFGFTSFFNDFSHEMTTAILPAFIQQLVGGAHAPLMLGIISGVSDFASSIVKVWSGLLTDRLKRYKLFLIVGYALTPLFVGIIGTAQYIWQVLLYKTIAWIGRGIREPMRDTWITQSVSPEYYGQAFGFVRAFDTLGSIAGPLVVFFMLKKYSLQTIFFVSLIPGLLSVLALIFFTHEEIHHQYIAKYHNWIDHLKKLSKKFNYFIFIMFIFGIANFNKMLIIFRAQEALTGQSGSSIIATGWAVLLYVLFNIIRAMSEYGLGTLSDYQSRKNILAFCGFGLFGIINILLMFSSHSLLMWGAIFLGAGMSTGAVTALEKSYAALLLPPELRGTGFGLLQMMDGIGDLISSIVVGFLWAALAPVYGFFYAVIMSFIATILLFNFKD